MSEQVVTVEFREEELDQLGKSFAAARRELVMLRREIQKLQELRCTLKKAIRNSEK